MNASSLAAAMASLPTAVEKCCARETPSDVYSLGIEKVDEAFRAAWWVRRRVATTVLV